MGSLGWTLFGLIVVAAVIAGLLELWHRWSNIDR